MNTIEIHTEKWLELEHLLLSQFQPKTPPENAPIIFLLGASRTGSTFLYQALIHRFSFFYFSNLANEIFSDHPIIALALQTQLKDTIEVHFQNRYGKTKGLLQPSEASLIHKNWFGGQHPAQLHSKRIPDDKRPHMIQTLASACQMHGGPFVIKNAWNCFRIENLAELFPHAFFIWIRRDIINSAISDLATRYQLRSSPNIWNSATPWNYEQLQKQPYWEQVVENQYEFNTAIQTNLTSYAQNRHLDIWYERLYQNPSDTLRIIENKLSDFFGNPMAQNPTISVETRTSQTQLDGEDRQRILDYAKQHQERFQPFRYFEKTSQIAH